MADARSPRRSKDLCALLGYSDKGKASSILDISKAYKFFTTRWHHDHDRKNPSSNKSKANRDDASKESSSGKEEEERISSCGDATTSWEADDPSSHHRHCKRGDSSVDDSFVFRRRPSFLSKSTSRRSQTPTPSSFSRVSSRRCHSVADFLGGGLGPFSNSMRRSRRVDRGSSDPPGAATTPTSASRGASSRTPTKTPERPTTPTSFSRSTSTRTPTRMMSAAGPGPSPDGPAAPTSFSRSTSTKTLTRMTSTAGPGPFPDGPATPTSISRSTSTRTPTRTMSRTMSSVRRGSGATPIVFSQTAARKKPQPIERKLECTLEELLHGCVKKVVIIRDVLSETGIIQEEETLKINVEPGWRKGTKIMFEGKGDEKPGYLPADIVFVIEERRHPLFKRRGDDLDIAVEIQLVQALTGCTISVPLLGGERVALCLEEIIHPGYEKAIPGQGMPCSKDPGRRGDLRITFFVEFPVQLGEAQRLEIRSILMECDSS